MDKIWSDWQAQYPGEAFNYNNNAKISVLDLETKMSLHGVRAKSERTYKAKHMLNTVSGAPLCYVYSKGVTLANNLARSLADNKVIPRDVSPDYMKLKCPIPLSASWIHQMNYTSQEIINIRYNEKAICDYIQHLNHDPSYVSQACTIASIPTAQRIWKPITTQEIMTKIENMFKMESEYQTSR